MNPQPYLVAYDIREPRRLQRVHSYLKRRALPVQYSVFIARLTPIQLQRLLAGLARLVDRTDDVRIYSLGHRPRVDTLGAQATEGVVARGAGAEGLE